MNQVISYNPSTLILREKPWIRGCTASAGTRKRAAQLFLPYAPQGSLCTDASPPSVTQATLGQTVKQVRANAETVINDAAGNLKKNPRIIMSRGKPYDYRFSVTAAVITFFLAISNITWYLRREVLKNQTEQSHDRWCVDWCDLTPFTSLLEKNSWISVSKCYLLLQSCADIWVMKKTNKQKEVEGKAISTTVLFCGRATLSIVKVGI